MLTLRCGAKIYGVENSYILKKMDKESVMTSSRNCTNISVLSNITMVVTAASSSELNTNTTSAQVMFVYFNSCLSNNCSDAKAFQF